MPVYKTAYETTLGRGIDISKAKQQVEDAQIASQALTLNYTDYMHGSANGEDLYGGIVTHGSMAETLVRDFPFPMLIADPLANPKHPKQLLIGNARPYMSLARNDEQGRKCRVTNLMEFELLHVALAANLVWLNKGTHVIMNMGDVVPMLYSRWIGNTLTNYFKLDQLSGMKVRLIAAYFYYCLFIEDEEISEKVQRSNVAAACRAAGGNMTAYETMFDGVGVINGMADFIATIKRVVPEAVQLDRLDSGILMERLMPSWFGFVGRAMAAAAIEHPPTFAAMLYMSFGQNGYRNASLSQLSKPYRTKGGTEFVRNMQLQLQLS